MGMAGTPRHRCSFLEQRIKTRKKPDVRSGLGENNLDVRIFDNSTNKETHDRDTDDITIPFRVVASRVGQVRVIPEREAVVPPAHDRITRLELQEALLSSNGTLLRCLCDTQVGGGYVSYEIIIVRVVDTSWEVESELCEDMSCNALVEDLGLVE